MSKEITKAHIIQEIEDKFKMRDFESAPFLFDETVIPTYEISPHLETRTIKSKTLSITSATFFEFFIVPADERWIFANYNLTFYNIGAYKVTGLFVTRTSSGAGAYIYLDQTAGQTGSYAVHLNTPVTVDPGDKLSVLIDTYVSTANLRLGVDVQLAKIR